MTDQTAFNALVVAARAVVDGKLNAKELCRRALAAADPKPVRVDPPLPPLDYDPLKFIEGYRWQPGDDAGRKKKRAA